MAATRRVGRYEIVGELGRGGMAVVHLARAPDGSRVALKELGGFHNGDQAAAERFLREALVGSSLDHPNIVAVIERLEDGGRPFLAMEWVDGGTLRPFVGELSIAQLGGVMEGLLGALAHAGRAGIVHRDLKPENVMLTSTGVVKVADFGIAKAKSAVEGMEGRLTRTGTTVGTPGYMAPEQAMSGEVTPATDLYAAGCIAFEALTGRVPFAGQAPMVMLMSHANQDVPDLRSIDPLIAPAIAEWVARMTARDPDARFADGEQAWAALERALVETLGEDWRESAAVHPEPQEVLPGPGGPDPNGSASGEHSPSGGAGARSATGAFATFAAPVALHEALAAELGERPAIGTPKSSPATTPPPQQRITRDELTEAVRRKTPPPHAAVGPSGATASAAAQQATRRGAPPAQRARRRTLLGAGAALVALAAISVVALTALSGGAGGSGGAALTAGGVTVRAPAGWSAHAKLAPVAGIAVSAAAAPSSTPSGAGVGLLATTDTAALASALLGDLGGANSIGIGNTRALALHSLRGELIAMPLASGAAGVLVCDGQGATASCASVAHSASGALGGAPAASDAQALRASLALQSPAVSASERALAGARSAGEQAAAAAALARDLDLERGAVTGASVSPAAHLDTALLAGALGALGQAWAAWGHAVAAGSHTAAAADALRRDRSTLLAAIRASAILGLALQSDLAAGPTPPRALAITHSNGHPSGTSGSPSSSSSSSPSSSPSTAPTSPSSTTSTSPSSPSSTPSSPPPSHSSSPSGGGHKGSGKAIVGGGVL